MELIKIAFVKRQQKTTTQGREDTDLSISFHSSVFSVHHREVPSWKSDLYLNVHTMNTFQLKAMLQS